MSTIETTQENLAEIDQCSQRLSDLVARLQITVLEAKEDTAEYGEKLKGVASSQTPDVSEQIRQTMVAIIEATQDMMGKNESLRAELSQFDSDIADLRSDLDEARRETTTDSLTGIANRRFYDTVMAQIVEECKVDETSLCLLVVDIDKFKLFNDKYGHQIGDQVIRFVAKNLVEGVKGKDMVARYGGEEFVILIHDVSLQDAISVAESLRQFVGKKSLVWKPTNEKISGVTVSIGVADLKKGETIDDLFKRADTAVYEAKESGGNTVAVAR